MTPEEQKLYDYLELFHAPVAWQAWGLLRAAVPELAMSNDGAVEDGHVILTWNRADLHLELEVLPNGVGEFFFWDRATDVTWYYDWTIGAPLPEDAIPYLRYFEVPR